MSKSLRPRTRTRLLVAVSVTGLAVAALPVLGFADQPAPAPTAAGRVVSWGGAAADLAALTPPADLVDAVAVVANRTYDDPYSLALRADGTVVGWGKARFGQDTPPDGLTDVVAVDTGAGFSMALRADGSVATWGTDSTGQLDVPGALGPATAIAAGGFRAADGTECGYALAVRADGTVARWGQAASDGPCGSYLGDALNPPAGLDNVVAVSAGERHALALRSDGTVVGWGLNGAGQATPPDGLSGVVAVTAGSDHSLAVKDDGTVVGWGVWGESGPPAETNVQAASAAVADVFLARDGSLDVYRGYNGAWTPPAGTDFVAVAAGYDHGLAIERVAPSTDPSATQPPSTDPSATQPPPTDPSATQPPPTDPSATVPASTEPPVTEPSPSEPPVTQPPAAQPLVGSGDVQPSTDSNPAGTAEAFQYVAAAGGTATSANVYLDAGSTADTVLVALYSGAYGQPRTLLASGTIIDPKPGAWNQVAIPPTAIKAGGTYWLALVNPSGSTGTVKFRDLPDGTGGPTQTCADVWLTAAGGLPTRWHTGTRHANSPASIYLS
jgi:hypothetical protein